MVTYVTNHLSLMNLYQQLDRAQTLVIFMSLFLAAHYLQNMKFAQSVGCK